MVKIMKIINPVYYNYFNSYSNAKRISNSQIKKALDRLSYYNYYFIDINSSDFNYMFVRLERFVENFELDKKKYIEYCTIQERKELHRTIKNINNIIKYTEEAKKDGYDTLLLKKNIEYGNMLIRLNFNFRVYNDDSDLFNIDMNNITIIDKMCFYNITNKKKEDIVMNFLSKLNFNVKELISNYNEFDFLDTYNLKRINEYQTDYLNISEETYFLNTIHKLKFGNERV